jgi:hypothetical protein
MDINNTLIERLEFITSNLDNKNKDEDYELEVRFGFFKRNSFYPNINRNAFLSILESSSSQKNFNLIIDTRYKDFEGLYDNNDKIIKRSTYNGASVQKVLKDIYNNFLTLSKEDLYNIQSKLDKKKISLRNIFLSKNKKTTNDNVNHLRVTFAIEKQHSLKNLMDKYVKSVSNNNKGLIQFAKSLENIEAERIKFRYSWLEYEVWRIDSTITVSVNYDENNPDSYKLSLSFEVEIEFDVESYTKLAEKPSLDEIISNVNKLILQYKTYIDNNTDISIEDLLETDISNQVVTLERDKIQFLQNSPYSITDKADGERKYLYINNNGVFYYVNPRTFQKIKIYEDSKINIKNSVIDGEFLETQKLFLGFDCLFINGEDCRSKNLINRLKCLEKIISKIEKGISKIVEVRSKKFYFKNIFKKTKKLWDDREKLFQYHLDGLIYTPINSAYNSSIPTLKWKDKHSIDVRVIYNNRSNFTEFHANGYPQKRNINGQIKITNVWRRYHGDDLYKHWIKVNDQSYKNLRLVNQYGLLGFYGRVRTLQNMEDIAEFEYDYDKQEWIFLRRRSDKNKPNARLTILSVLKAIEENITLNELSELVYEESEYEKMCEKSCTNIDPIGLHYDIVSNKGTSDKRMNWRFFQNFVKRQLFNESSVKLRKERKYLFDIGSGRGGDLNKWLESGYTDILAIDPSRREIYGRHYSEGFSGLVERVEQKGFTKMEDGSYKGSYKNNEINITPVWGDATKDIKTGSSGYNNYEKTKLLNFLSIAKKEKWQGFDTISIMFVIHYMFATMKKGKNVLDKKRFEIFMKNVVKYLNKKKGLFIGSYLDGHHIMKHIRDDFTYFIQRDDNNEPFYGITLKNGKNMITGDEIDYDIFWDKNPKMIGIKQSIWGWNNEIAEPMLFEKNLDVVFQKFNLFSIKKNNNFEKYYKKYLRSSNRPLSISEKNISFLNNVFMYSVYPSFETQNYKILKKLKNK